MLGAAIGDAMGHPTEFLDMGGIHGRYGPDGVRGFELFWEEGGRRFAPYTDDTQMAEVVLRTLIAARERGLDLDATMQRMADRFVAWMYLPQGGHRAPGNSCLAGCRALDAGAPWNEAGAPDAGGCGSVMRAWPFGLVFPWDCGRVEQWAVAHSRLTHGAPIALAACAAVAVGVARTVRGAEPAAISRAMIDAAGRYDRKTAGMMGRAQADALSGVPPDETLDRLRGWAAHEAIAASLYIFLRHADDPEEAILEGANTPGDSDSLASITGALVGARCGLEALPAEWVQQVERSEALLRLAARIDG